MIDADPVRLWDISVHCPEASTTATRLLMEGTAAGAVKGTLGGLYWPDFTGKHIYIVIEPTTLFGQ